MNTVNWEDSSWKYLSLVGDEEVISLLHAKVYVFSDSVLCLGKMNEKPQSNIAWEDRLTLFKSSQEYRTLDRIDGEPIEFEWNIFSGIHHIAALQQSPRVTVKVERNTRKNHWTDHLHGRCSTTSRGDLKTVQKECESSALLVSLYAKRFSAGRWSFLGPGSEKKWYSISEDSPQGECDRIAEQMELTFAESKHPVFGATSPLSRGTLKKQRRWTIINTLLCRPEND